MFCPNSTIQLLLHCQINAREATRLETLPRIEAEAVSETRSNYYSASATTWKMYAALLRARKDYNLTLAQLHNIPLIRYEPRIFGTGRGI